jgi:hypothetical protein
MMFDYSIQGVGYGSKGAAIEGQRIAIYIQLLINIIITMWYIKNKSTYNWQLMLTNIVVLCVLHFIVFVCTFVTVNYVHDKNISMHFFVL